MTKREETLLFFDDFLKSVGLDYMIFASSLLGIVRDGHLLEHDSEIDLCVLGTDLNEEVMTKIRASGYFMDMYKCSQPYGEFYLSNAGRLDSETGWVAISPLWKKENTLFLNVVNDECILWKNIKDINKNNWSDIKYCKKRFNAPLNPKDWLANWYGEDWKQPKETSWRENKNRRKWGEF